MQDVSKPEEQEVPNLEPSKLQTVNGPEDIHRFNPPASVGEVFPHRISKINGLTYVVVRCSNPEKISAGGVTRIAVNAIKDIPGYGNCGIESTGAMYPVDPITGEVLAVAAVDSKPIFERKFRLNSDNSLL